MMDSTGVNSPPIIRAYISYLEGLSPESVHELKDLATEHMIFEDPFNRVSKVDDVMGIFRKMFEDVQNPSFSIGEVFRSGEAFALLWEFSYSSRWIRKGEKICFPGMSLVRLSADGKISEHRDFWDSGEHFYLELPFIGAMIQRIRNRVRYTERG